MVCCHQADDKPIITDEIENTEPGTICYSYAVASCNQSAKPIVANDNIDLNWGKSLADIISENTYDPAKLQHFSKGETLSMYARALEVGLHYSPEYLGNIFFRQLTDTPKNPTHLRLALKQAKSWKDEGCMELREFDIEPLCPNGSRLAYRAKVAIYTLGKDTGENRVLCLAGYQGNVGQLGLIVKTLLNHGKSVLMIDWDGHGLSDGNNHQTALQMWGLLKSVVARYYPSGHVKTVVTHSVASHVVRIALAKRWFTVERHVMIAASHPMMSAQFEHIFKNILKLGPTAWPCTRQAFERCYGAGTFDLQDNGIPRGTKVLSIRPESDKMCPASWEEAYAALHADDEDYLSVIMKGLNGHNHVLEANSVAKAVIAFI